jgi:hypothetical protein
VLPKTGTPDYLSSVPLERGFGGERAVLNGDDRLFAGHAPIVGAEGIDDDRRSDHDVLELLYVHGAFSKMKRTPTRVVQVETAAR